MGTTPQTWNTGIYNMIRTLSENVMMPIAGLILAFVMTLELIQIITDKNNFHDIESAIFFRWIFKTACAILIVTNTCHGIRPAECRIYDPASRKDRQSGNRAG